MTLLLYGVAPADARTATGDGLADRPLRTVAHENVQAIVSDIEQPPSTVTDNLWAYERILERLMQDVAVLPARFGTTADSDEDVVAMLATRHDELSESLERVRGAVEFAVRAADPDDARSARPTSGTQYINRLLHRDHRMRRFDANVAGFTRATRRRGTSTAYLVEKAGAGEFVDHAQAEGLIVTGPWPPFSFVGES